MANTKKAEVLITSDGIKKVKIERKPSFPKLYELIEDDINVEAGLYELDYFETPSVNLALEKPIINYKKLSAKGRNALK